MGIIDRLIGRSGDVRSLLGIKDQSEPFDISDDDWQSRLEVLTGLEFQKIRLVGKEVKTNFAECRFDSCEFSALLSDGHFWGASDRWFGCVFQAVALVDPISPMNMFWRCRFNDFSLTAYKPYQTMFCECEFDRCSVTGMRPQLIRNETKLNPDLASLEATVLFRKCSFADVIFDGCSFKQTAFEACRFTNVETRSCDFSGIDSSDKWWSEQKGDPYTSFLSKLLQLIEKHCGNSSAAYAEIENCLSDYTTGRVTSKDFSASLYSGKVPDFELDRIEPELEELMHKYPF